MLTSSCKTETVR